VDRMLDVGAGDLSLQSIMFFIILTAAFLRLSSSSASCRALAIRAL
jgi:hypothetical protein